MREKLCVAKEPKTGTFQMRMSPRVKEQAEEIFSQCGMTLTDAVNVFIQQALNVEGMPFILTQNSKEALREQAISRLMMEIKQGEDSVKEESDWISEEILLAEFGVEL